MKITHENDSVTEKKREMRIGLRISVTDRSQITNPSADTQILKWRTTWGNLCSIFLSLRDFDYLPRLFLSRLPPPPNAALAAAPACGRRLQAMVGWTITTYALSPDNSSTADRTCFQGTAPLLESRHRRPPQPRGSAWPPSKCY